MGDRLTRPSLMAAEARKGRDVDTLLDLLTSTDPRGRISAAHQLGELKSIRAVRPLARCLNARHEVVRMAALNALGKIGDPSIADDVFDVGKNDESFWVRTRAADALAAMGDRREVQLLIGLLILSKEAPHTRRYRNWAVKRLVELNAKEAMPALEAAARDKALAGPVGRWRLRRAVRALRSSTRPSPAGKGGAEIRRE